ncbi:B-cell receptor CD22-like [Gadus chalcogrammus]|uniref:B-cell receptor CD22-like n=1 Tax=Gadus chalcogrammus TaxID=1042646 RepID=UPI0024C4B92E|nr:B-cell receptor CD22-like [Gadus chalcogrammus]
MNYWIYIQSGDSYSCAVEGYEHFLSPLVYAPKTPSVTVSPSGEIEEGSSVTLSCSSDANPAANYTWFREHEDSVKASGQNYTITNITSELGGNYYCQAHNAIGFHNSTFLLIKVCIQCLKSTSSSRTTTVAVRGIVVLLATVLLLVFLWMRRKWASRKACGQGGRPDTIEELLPVPVYENVPALTNRLAHAAQREPIEEQDGHHCAIIHTSASDNQDQDQMEMGGTSEL